MDADRTYNWRPRQETVMMLGIFNPWTVRDTETFKRAITKTGQVAIMVRQVNLNEHWTLDIEKIAEQIREALTPLGYYEEKHYIIAEVPNIVMAFTGPDKDYKDEQTLLDTAPPDSAFKTADLKDPWADVTHPEVKHEDWEEG